LLPNGASQAQSKVGTTNRNGKVLLAHSVVACFQAVAGEDIMVTRTALIFYFDGFSPQDFTKFHDISRKLFDLHMCHSIANLLPSSHL